MVIVFEKNATEAQIQAAQNKIRESGLEAHRSDGVDHTILGLVGDLRQADRMQFALLPGVFDVVRISSPYKLASREFRPDNSVVHVKDIPIGGPEVVVMAGPCAIESLEQIEISAARVAEIGARILRGGAFKPRTSPYSFQGLGEQGLKLVRAAADRHGLAVVSEVLTIEQIPLVSEYADLLQVGARNMQNYPLLASLGEITKPVLLKRGLSATVTEWLMSAEYILAGGNTGVILCERGIRTFETATRNTLDISAVCVVKHLSHLPVVVDPSHGVGDRRFIEPMARAAVASGADGIMVEVHPDPDNALSDGPQSLNPDQFASLMNRCRIIATTLGRRIRHSG